MITPGPIRILLCDDHRMITEGLAGMLAGERDMDVVGVASDGAQALELLAHLGVDVLLLDINMPGMDGFATLERIKGARLPVRVVLLTMHEEGAVAQRAMELGADGYLVKDAGKQELLLAIRKVHAGERHLSSSIVGQLMKGGQAGAGPEGPFKELSEREVEVLTAIAEGLTNKEIGERLFISPRTVDTHRTNLMKKLDVHNVAGLVRMAIRAGLVQ